MAELITTTLYNDANLQEYYQLEGLTGKNGNTLTNNNSVTFTAAKYNNGANLGTSNTNKTLSVASALGFGTGAYSIVGWVKILTEPALNSSYFLYGVKNTSGVGLHIQYGDSGGQKQLTIDRVRLGVADDNAIGNITALGTTTFHHIAETYDGTNLLGYVDGIQVATGTSTGVGTGGANQTWLGADQGGSGPGSAILDDFACFNRKLTAAEVLTLATDAKANGGFFLAAQ